MTNSKASPWGKTHCACQDTHTSVAKTWESLPGAFPCLLTLASLGDSGRNRGVPSVLCTFAAFAALSSHAPSGQLCRASPRHSPSVGRGDVGHACVLGQSPLPDPKETGENVESCSISCNASFSSNIQNKHRDVQTGQNLHQHFRHRDLEVKQALVLPQHRSSIAPQHAEPPRPLD